MAGGRSLDSNPILPKASNPNAQQLVVTAPRDGGIPATPPSTGDGGMIQLPSGVPPLNNLPILIEPIARQFTSKDIHVITIPTDNVISAATPYRIDISGTGYAIMDMPDQFKCKIRVGERGDFCTHRLDNRIGANRTAFQSLWITFAEAVVDGVIEIAYWTDDTANSLDLF